MDWDSPFQAPSSLQVAACLLALQHDGKNRGDAATWDVYKHIQTANLIFSQLMQNSVCRTATAAAVNSYPEQDDDRINLFIDSAKCALDQTTESRLSLCG